MLRIRYHEFWLRVKERLSTPRMLQLLQGGKVYLEGENYSQPENTDQTKIWARLVIVPTSTLWPEDPGIGPMRRMGFLTRAEVHSNNDPAYFPQQTLDAIQDECLVQLRHYEVPKQKYIMGARGIWQHRPPQPLPLWDETRGLYFTSAEYRVEVAPARGEISSVVLSQDNVVFSGDPIVFSGLGAPVQLYARGRVTDGTLVSGLQTTWVSLDPTIATISSTGLLTRLKTGIARLSVTIEGVTSQINVMIGEFAYLYEGLTAIRNLVPRNKDLAGWALVAGATVTPGQPLRRSNFGVRYGNPAQTSAIERLLATDNVDATIFVASFLWKADTAVGTRTLRVRSTTQGLVKAQLEWESAGDGSPTNLRVVNGTGGGAYHIADGYYCVYVFSDDFTYTDVMTMRIFTPPGYDLCALPMFHRGRSPVWPILNDTDDWTLRSADSTVFGSVVAPYLPGGQFFSQAMIGSFGKKITSLFREENSGTSMTLLTAYIGVMQDGPDKFGWYETATSFGLPWLLQQWNTGAFATGIVADAMETKGRVKAFVVRSDGVTQYSYVGGLLNVSVPMLSPPGGLNEANFMSLLGNWYFHSIATFDNDIGEAEAIAAEASERTTWPVGARIFDFTKGKLPEGFVNKRASEALDDEFSIVPVNTPRFVRVPEDWPAIIWVSEPFTLGPLHARQLNVLAAHQLVIDAFEAGVPVVAPTIRYETQDPAIATVDNTGLITAVAPGITNIFAWYRTACVRLQVTVV